MSRIPDTVYTNHIPDLIGTEDYRIAPERKIARFRIAAGDAGIEIIGDSPYPAELEAILKRLGSKYIEMMLCG